ncbi:SDR family NAD(P)-dependent oxidoreductase [Nocardia sp. NPDC058480]|uniref:SDR family NAD(P)-dependent oxidoreductase n=1 Tax=unclassified Nocardia TaxID=2637762 RepID=UPI00364D0949
MTKSALISGASRGIGLGIANRLAQQGYSLTITARDADRLDTVAADLRARGAAEVIAVAADMSDEEGVARVLTAHMDRHSTIEAVQGIQATDQPSAGQGGSEPSDQWARAVPGVPQR